MDNKKLFLFVDIVDKPADVISNSAITEVAVSNVGHDNATGQGDCNNEAVVSPLIDWDSLEIIPLVEDQIGAALPMMNEEAMYEFVGLRAEDERVEQARMAVEKENESNVDDLNL
ncbi:unnamed protein product [Miscanthus lutarioriparius]|uniref:Uncharacterized protein n=1 Tax=Miscanthus lutarioriparius TaxID=422564 RepID=A0A811PZK3_9POAL|nr:unnamed protein product [Miscanthus lutarioriparius]